MPIHSVRCSAPADRVWELIARPDLWSEWSPHVRGAEGLGSPEVSEGARGSVVLRGGLRLGAEITEVTPGSSWSWRAAGLDIHHRVAPSGSGSRLEFEVASRGGPRSALALAYAPVVGLIAKNIARVAERRAAAAL